MKFTSRFTWLLALKVFISLFWITMLFSIIEDFLFRNYKLAEIDLMDLFVLCSPLSILFEKFYTKRSLMVTYFLCFFFYMVFYASFSFFIEYISYLKYNYHFTQLYDLVFNGKTLYISLSVMFIGFGLYGLISYFQNNYQRAKLCFIFFFASLIPFILVGNMIFS
ncbi:hypothetical protein [Helicobacter sp. MIT 14-3879]|uniref:hypothetical protein n=1 Tax=Helicobacter sp. MIT 14-3879 TaxID=2040649 RepID=UPI0011C04643|nr:hypothetical protein [Helicobacter sp. MIT 14-3879]